MIANIVSSIYGIFALDNDGNLLSYRIFDSVSDDISPLIKLATGQDTSIVIDLINDLIEMGVEKIVVENKYIFDNLDINKGPIIYESPSVGGLIFRSSPLKYLEYTGLKIDYNSYKEAIRRESIKFSEYIIRTSEEKDDRLIIQAINTVDDLDKIINGLQSRLREWYGLYFPMLDKIVNDPDLYTSIIFSLGSKEKFTFDALHDLNIPDEKIEEIINIAKDPMGAKFPQSDILPVVRLSEQILQLIKFRDELVKYIETKMNKIAPNITSLVGALLGARLISLAGGLEVLASKPSSTIQVLGAEKALFRSLKSGANPPKHGIIFQHPAIGLAPYWQRGKIARMLSGLISIAAKVDSISRRNISEYLQLRFQKRLDEIRRKYPVAPKKSSRKVKSSKRKNKSKGKKSKRRRN